MRSLFLALACAPLLANAQPPAGYYDPAEGLTGEPLRQALHNIIDGHTTLNYNSLWSYFPQTDRKTNGTVWDMYSDVPSGTPPYTFTFGADQCGNYDEEGDCFNREHSFPKSWFGGEVPPMHSDLHHLYPTDGYVNNKRGEFPFGEVGSADWTSDNGSKTGMNVSGGYSGTVFEPIDAYKGDFARAYFYMLTRYWGQTTSWSSPMLQNGDLAPWAENLLLAWHVADPVSAKETARNNVVFGYQDNRNPFIDNPQWPHAIWGAFASVGEVAELPARIWCSEGRLTVQLDALLPDAVLEVRDITGRAVLHATLLSDREVMTLDLPHGAYVATVSSGQRRAVSRFVH